MTLFLQEITSHELRIIVDNLNPHVTFVCTWMIRDRSWLEEKNALWQEWLDHNAAASSRVYFDRIYFENRDDADLFLMRFR